MIGFGPGSDGWVGAIYLLGDGGGGEYSIPRTGKGKEVGKYEVCSWIRGLICLAKTEDFYEKNDKKFTALLVRANEYVMHLIGGREPVSM